MIDLLIDNAWVTVENPPPGWKRVQPSELLNGGYWIEAVVKVTHPAHGPLVVVAGAYPARLASSDPPR